MGQAVRLLYTPPDDSRSSCEKFIDYVCGMHRIYLQKHILCSPATPFNVHARVFVGTSYMFGLVLHNAQSEQDMVDRIGHGQYDEIVCGSRGPDKFAESPWKLGYHVRVRTRDYTLMPCMVTEDDYILPRYSISRTWIYDLELV